MATQAHATMQAVVLTPEKHKTDTKIVSRIGAVGKPADNSKLGEERDHGEPHNKLDAEPVDKKRGNLETPLQHDSMLRRAGRLIFPIDRCGGEQTRAEHTQNQMTFPMERLEEQCAAQLNLGGMCQHVVMKVFPGGPRDNGEVYWQCKLCGIEL